MRWGIVGSGYDVACIANWLPDGSDIVGYIDRAWRPWGMKSADDVAVRLLQGVRHLQKQGVDHLIVPPYAEFLLMNKETDIFPLFHEYMKQIVLPGSRVGKIGFLGGGENDTARYLQELRKNLKKAYPLTAYQQGTKAFDASLPFWHKDCSHRHLHLPYASKRSWMMRHLIKHNLRYFKDVDVDTLVPFDRGFFYREKMITHRLGSRMKFHPSSSLRTILHRLPERFSTGKSLGVCELWVSASLDTFLASKDRRQCFDRGGKRDLIVNKISG